MKTPDFYNQCKNCRYYENMAKDNTSLTGYCTIKKVIMWKMRHYEKHAKYCIYQTPIQ